MVAQLVPVRESMRNDWPTMRFWQVPDTQDCVEAQRTLQAPQLLLSAAVVMHAPLQSTWPEGQAHARFTQVVPPAQTVPQAPQFWLSLMRFAQRLLVHSVVPVAQAPKVACRV
jgi:hypothetical protein